MNIPFIRFFKKEKTEEGSVAVAARPVVSTAKPAWERLSKTFMPNASRIIGLEPIGNLPVRPPASSPAQRAPAASRRISLGGNGSIAVAPKIPTSAPAAERTITLPMTDLVSNIPGELLKPSPVDPDCRVLLRAAEVERGMATGRPTVLLRSIYKEAPEFFTCEVPATDLCEVALPFAKVVEQFASFQVRDDQITDQEYPQLETPFLRVTLEDNERLGKPVTPPVTQEIPTVQPKTVAGAKLKVVAATPPAAPPATPEAAPKPIAPIRFSVPAPALAPTVKAPFPLDQPPPSAPTTAKISPNGTGAPAAEGVPASSGSPVPTPLPSPFAPLAPTRIPFKVSPPSNDLQERSKFPAPRTNPAVADSSNSGLRISLPLRNILRNVAPFQLSGPIDAVPDTVQIEIPFSIVQPQLSLGRVAISPTQFQAALPEEFRALFKADAADTPVPLALQDVLQNVPNESLQLRGDQEEPEVTTAFETPFSRKASEDAARMKVSAGPIANTTVAATEATSKSAAPAAEPAPKPAPSFAELTATAAVTQPKEASIEPAKEAPFGLVKETSKPAPTPKDEVTPATKSAIDAPAAAAPTRRTALQNIFDTDEPLNAKSVVAHVSRLPGVSACAIVFSDGLSLAGNVPAEYEADALCAMAPSIMKRIGEQMYAAKFGALSGLTLFCAKAPVSLFAHGNICLAALHSDGEIVAEVRDRVGRTTQELARMYAQPA